MLQIIGLRLAPITFIVLMLVARSAGATPPEDDVVTPLDAQETEGDSKLSSSDEPPDGAPLWLAVGGGFGSTGKGYQGLGMLTIGGTLDRVARPSRAKEAVSEMGASSGAPRKVVRPGQRAGDLDGKSSVAAAGALGSERGPRMRTIADGSSGADDWAGPTVVNPRPAELPNEPPPIEPRIDGAFARGLVRAVRARSGAQDAEARLEGLTTRARASALLPEVRFRVARVTNDTQTLSPTSYDPTRVTASGALGLWLDGRATFRLDRLVFADEEIAIERIRTERARMERALTMEVLGELVVWQRGAARAADPTLPDDDRVTGEIAQLSAAAALDVLSDGWFSAHRPKTER